MLQPTSAALQPTSTGAADPIDLTGSPSPVGRQLPRRSSHGTPAPPAGEPCDEELPLRERMERMAAAVAVPLDEGGKVILLQATLFHKGLQYYIIMN